MTGQDRRVVTRTVLPLVGALAVVAAMVGALGFAPRDTAGDGAGLPATVSEAAGSRAAANTIGDGGDAATATTTTSRPDASGSATPGLEPAPRRPALATPPEIVRPPGRPVATTEGPTGADPTSPPAERTSPHFPDDPSWPAMERCRLTDDGLAPGQRRICRFTATDVGGAFVRHGYEAPPDLDSPDLVRVVVHRPDGSSREWTEREQRDVDHPNVYVGSCDVFIEPGDRVEAELVAGADQRSTELLAGRHVC